MRLLRLITALLSGLVLGFSIYILLIAGLWVLATAVGSLFL